MPVPYVILCNDREFICPIKALRSPYGAGGPAYLGGQPNFFGGAQNARESVFQALQREVDEESSQTVMLTAYVNQPAYRGEFERRGVMVQADFYYSLGWLQRGPWPGIEQWRRMLPKYREMCFNVTVDRNDFSFLFEDLDDRVVLLSLTDIYDVIYRTVRNQAPVWVVDQTIDSPTQDFRDSETARAFVSFVNLWLTRRLPGWAGVFHPLPGFGDTRHAPFTRPRPTKIIHSQGGRT